jgi:HEPN superfamily RiboL-PSP-like protein
MRDDGSAFRELLNGFRAELASILQMVDIADTENGFESGTAANDTMLQASLVLAVAQAEGYTKQIVAEFVDHLNRSGVPIRRVSEPIRLLHTFQAIQDLASCETSVRAARIRSLRHQLNNWWDDDRALRPSDSTGREGLISKRKVQREVTSISAEQIASVFELIGCERNICDEAVNLIDAEELRALLSSDTMSGTSENEAREPWEIGTASVNIGEKLTDLVGKRNTIAHGNGKVPLTPKDILEALAFFCSYGERVQYVIVDHLRATLTLG